MACITFLLLLLALDDVAPPRTIPPDKLTRLEHALKSTLFAALPTPLYQGDNHWGDTAKTPNGLKWKNGKPEVQYAEKNHGAWRKYLVNLDQPVRDHVRLRLSDAQHVGNNTIRFALHLEADVNFEITQQNWNHGIKLFAGSVNGRATVKADLHCESKLVIEPTTSLIPTIKYRLRVVKASPSYDKLVFTHVPGLGGSAAKAVGNWTMDAVQQLKPSLERKLLDKLTQKIVKAADTKEIQLSLSGVERKK